MKIKNVCLSFLALSSLAVAKNPAPGNEANPATVPVKIQCEVLVPKTGITITDETGMAIDELLIDHKYLAKGFLTKDSIAYKTFKVVRYFDDKGTIINHNLAQTNIQGYSLFVELNKGKINPQETILQRLGGGPANSTITSKLSLEGRPGSKPLKDIRPTSYEAPLTSSEQPGNIVAEKEHIGRVISTITTQQINDNPDLQEGTYTTDLNNILSVTIKAESN